jgi:hypothetical protein
MRFGFVSGSEALSLQGGSPRTLGSTALGGKAKGVVDADDLIVDQNIAFPPAIRRTPVRQNTAP